jgi:hypothetical protein
MYRFFLSDIPDRFLKRNASLSILCIFWVIYSLFIIAFYKSTLLAHLTSLEYGKPINTDQVEKTIKI